MLDRIKDIAKLHGATASEIIPVKELNLNFYSKIVANYPLELYYLKKIDIRKDIKNFFPEAKSILICLYQYWNSRMNYEEMISQIKSVKLHLKESGRKIPSFLEKDLLKGNKLARYSLSYDYHKKIREILNQTLSAIKKEFPQINGKIFVDTSPVVEKELAKISGLGWQGKNTLIINKKYGSYFFIAGIALNIAIENNIILQEDLCKNCNRCLSACPTGALMEYKLDPLKCISYWTTHNKEGEIPEEIIKKNSGYIYGCDICQEVCPYNLKISEPVHRELLPLGGLQRGNIGQGAGDMG